MRGCFRSAARRLFWARRSSWPRSPWWWAMSSWVSAARSGIHTVVRGDVNFVRIGRGVNLQDHAVVHVHHRHPPGADRRRGDDRPCRGGARRDARRRLPGRDRGPRARRRGHRRGDDRGRGERGAAGHGGAAARAPGRIAGAGAAPAHARGVRPGAAHRRALRGAGPTPGAGAGIAAVE